MNWLVAFLILFVIIIVALGVMLNFTLSWRRRFKWIGVLFLPVALFMWDYPIVYYQHIKTCDAEGGLKVFIQPEKSDGLQLRSPDHSYGESDAQGILYHYYPAIKFVESPGSIRESVRIPKVFFAYSVSTTNNAKRSNDWSYSKKPLAAPSNDLYVLTKSVDNNKKRTKYEWQLTKNNQLYATFTDFWHRTSNGIRYPDAVGGLSWHCRERSSSPSEFKYPEKNLIKLILK